MRAIDADALLQRWRNILPRMAIDREGAVPADFRLVIREVSETPTLTLDDLRPKGRWEDKYDGKYANQVYRCSACGVRAMNVDNKAWFLPNFCPHCGADMRGGGEGG